MVYRKSTQSTIRLLLIVLAIGACVFGATLQKAPKIPATGQKALIQKTHNDLTVNLKQQESALWKKITKLTGVTQQQCEQERDSWISTYKTVIMQDQRDLAKIYGTVPTDIQKRVTDLLQRADLATQDIKIIAYQGEGSPAKSNDFTVLIDKNVLGQYCREAQDAIIAHEIMHIKHKDSSFFSTLFDLIGSNKEAVEIAQQIFKLHELWADIDALALGPVIIDGHIKGLNTFIKQYGNLKSSTHPMPKQRLTVAENMQKAYQHA